MSEREPDDPHSPVLPRLRAARALLTVDLDRAHLQRLAVGLGQRQRLRARRRQVLLGAGAASAMGLLLLLASQTRRSLDPRPPANQAVRASGGSVPRSFAPLAPAGTVTDEGLVVPGPGQFHDQTSDVATAAARWATYQRSPDTSARLPNVSYAGYRYGERGPRRPPARVVNVRQQPFGAVGDGASDDTAAIRRAIDSVEAEGGVVYLPDGTYRVSGVLFVHGNGTVIRGESRARTRLLFTQTLDQAMGPSMAGSSSRWEWSGGLLWFAPRPRQSYPRGGSVERPGLWPGSAPDWARRGWPVGAPLARVVEPASRGDRALVVSEADRLAAGAVVYLTVPASEALLAAGWPRSSESTEQPDYRRGATPVVRWPVEITRVDGDVITLAQPLRFDVTLAGGDGRPTLLQAIPAGQTIRDVGVEQLTMVMQRERPWSGQAVRVAEPFGWNGPFFLNTVHGFARQVTVLNGDLGLGTAASKNITLEDVELRAEGLPADLTPHRALAIRAQSHDVLVQGLSMDPRWVGVRVEGSGFVLSRARGRFSEMTGQAVDSLLTDLTEVGEGLPAATGSLAGSGQRVVGWNLRRREDRPPPSTASLPANLYEAQRRLRLAR